MIKGRFLSFTVPALLIACVSCTPPQQLVYSAGFSFSKYDFLVFSKPGEGTTTALFGLDIEIANMMARYNMTVIGDKEFPTKTIEEKEKTLVVRFAISTFNKKENLITVSFDDGISGKTVASLTSQAKGNMFKPSDRTNALELVSRPLSEALTHEKGLKIKNNTPG